MHDMFRESRVNGQHSLTARLLLQFMYVLINVFQFHIFGLQEGREFGRAVPGLVIDWCQL